MAAQHIFLILLVTCLRGAFSHFTENCDEFCSDDDSCTCVFSRESPQETTASSLIQKVHLPSVMVSELGIAEQLPIDESGNDEEEVPQPAINIFSLDDRRRRRADVTSDVPPIGSTSSEMPSELPSELSRSIGTAAQGLLSEELNSTFMGSQLSDQERHTSRTLSDTLESFAPVIADEVTRCKTMKIFFIWLTVAGLARLVHAKPPLQHESQASVGLTSDSEQGRPVSGAVYVMMLVLLVLATVAKVDGQMPSNKFEMWEVLVVPSFFTVFGYGLTTHGTATRTEACRLRKDILIRICAVAVTLALIMLSPLQLVMPMSRVHLLPCTALLPLLVCAMLMPAILDVLPKEMNLQSIGYMGLYLSSISLFGSLACTPSLARLSCFHLTLLYGLAGIFRIPEFAIGVFMGHLYTSPSAPKMRTAYAAATFACLFVLGVIIMRTSLTANPVSVLSAWSAGGMMSPLVAGICLCFDTWASAILPDLWACLPPAPLSATSVFAVVLLGFSGSEAPLTQFFGLLVLCYFTEWCIVKLCCQGKFQGRASRVAKEDSDEIENASAARAQGYVAMGKFHGANLVTGVLLCILFWFVFCLHMYTHLLDSRLLFAENHGEWIIYMREWIRQNKIDALGWLSVLAVIPLAINAFLHFWYPVVWRQPSLTMPQLLTLDGTDSLIMHFRYVTRGSNPNLVNKNVAVAESLLKASGLPLEKWCLEVITDSPVLDPTYGHGSRISEVVVPSSYVCPNGGKYKARALHYAITAELAVPIRDHDWIVHLDEETSFDVHTVCACYAHCLKQNAEVAEGLKQVPNIGQGVIVYNYCHTPDFQLAALADVARVSDDFGRFRGQYEFGRPLIGMHGSFVVASQKVERLIGYDHGYAGSITEDTFFALYAWGNIDLKWSFIDAFMFEQSPFCTMDFIRQRARWFHGICMTIATPASTIPFRCRLSLALGTLAWSTIFVWGPFMVVITVLDIQFTGFRSFFIDLSGALGIWHYMLGFMMNFSPHSGGWDRWVLSLWMIFSMQVCFSMMEAGGIILGLKLVWDARAVFHVVQKERPKAGSKLENVNSVEAEGAAATEEAKGACTTRQAIKQTAATGAATLCVHEAFAARANAHPGTTALMLPGGVAVLYGDLLKKSSKLASAMKGALGVAQGDVVALALPHSTALPVAVLAALEIGAAWLPIEPSATARTRSILGDAVPKLLVTIDGLAATMNKDLPASLTVCLIDVDGELVTDFQPIREKIHNSGTTSSLVRMEWNAAIIYTSGNCGAPTGVVCKHQMLADQCRWMANLCNMQPDTKVLVRTPFAWAVSYYEILAPLTVGATAVIVDESVLPDSTQLVRTMMREHINVLFAPSSTLRQIVVAAQEERSDVKSLQHVVQVGEALPTQLATSLLQYVLPEEATLHNVYGTTESPCTVWTVKRSHLESSRELPEHVPAGVPQPGAGVVLVNSSLQPVLEGEIGEVCFSGIMARGYHANAKLTAERFVQGPRASVGGRLHRTGDRGRLPHSGVLEILGRTDRQLNHCGARIQPEEIEVVALSTPSGPNSPTPSAAVVVVVDDMLVACVTPKNVDARAVQQHCAAQLPKYFTVDEVVAFHEFPVLPNGKVDVSSVGELARSWLFQNSSDGSGVSMAFESFGGTRGASKQQVQAQRIIHILYAMGILGMIIGHLFHCDEHGCGVLRKSHKHMAPPWVDVILKALSCETYMLLLVLGAAFSDAMRSPQVELGIQDIFGAVIIVALHFWPFAGVAHGEVVTEFIARWYLLILLIARMSLAVGRHMNLPQWVQTAMPFILAVCMPVQCPVDHHLPVVLYQFLFVFSPAKHLMERKWLFFVGLFVGGRIYLPGIVAATRRKIAVMGSMASNAIGMVCFLLAIFAAWALGTYRYHTPIRYPDDSHLFMVTLDMFAFLTHAALCACAVALMPGPKVIGDLFSLAGESALASFLLQGIAWRMPINLHAHVLCRGVYDLLGSSSIFLGPALFGSVLLYCFTIMLVFAPLLQLGLNKIVSVIVEDHDLPVRVSCKHERAVGAFQSAKATCEEKKFKAFSNAALCVGKVVK